MPKYSAISTLNSKIVNTSWIEDTNFKYRIVNGLKILHIMYAQDTSGIQQHIGTLPLEMRPSVSINIALFANDKDRFAHVQIPSTDGKIYYMSNVGGIDGQIVYI